MSLPLSKPSPVGSSIAIAIWLSIPFSRALPVMMLMGDWFKPEHWGDILDQFSGPYAVERWKIDFYCLQISSVIIWFRLVPLWIWNRYNRKMNFIYSNKRMGFLLTCYAVLVSPVLLGCISYKQIRKSETDTQTHRQIGPISVEKWS